MAACLDWRVHVLGLAETYKAESRGLQRARAESRKCIDFAVFVYEPLLFRRSVAGAGKRFGEMVCLI
jgi:hypothetical protein